MWLFSLLAVVHVIVIVYFLYKLVTLLTGDADLQVLGSRLKPDYYKDRVVWVTGASSGSTYPHISHTPSHRDYVKLLDMMHTGIQTVH